MLCHEAGFCNTFAYSWNFLNGVEAAGGEDMPVMLFVSEREVYALLPMLDCIDLMHDTFAALAHNGSVQPLRIIAWQPDMRGAIATMPAWRDHPRVAADRPSQES